MTQTAARPDLAAPSAPSADVPSLSEAMRVGSLDAHRAAESSPFVTRLMSGRVTSGDYATYLVRLQAVYTELEGLVERHRDDPVVGRVHDDRLLRSASLAADLQHWRRAAGVADAIGGGCRSAAVTAYRARLRAAARQPWLLVAHHYTRYLGDLSGGRILARRLTDTFGGAGLAFYDFPGITEPVVYKRGYRDRLDALPLTAEQRPALVAEVRAAFDLNRALLAELG